MYDYKILFGIVSVVIALLSYIPYLRDLFLGKTKPHAFSWLLWSLLSSIAFVANLLSGAKAGAWVLGASSLVCIFITIYSFIKGEKNYVVLDWICLIFALLSIPVWLITDSALYAIIMITIIDLVAFIPTFRKTYYKPYEETLITYSMSAIKYVFGLLAISTFSLTTVLYMSYLIIINLLFVAMAAFRRSQIKN